MPVYNVVFTEHPNVRFVSKDVLWEDWKMFVTKMPCLQKKGYVAPTPEQPFTAHIRMTLKSRMDRFFDVDVSGPDKSCVHDALMYSQQSGMWIATQVNPVSKPPLTIKGLTTISPSHPDHVYRIYVDGAAPGNGNKSNVSARGAAIHIKNTDDVISETIPDPTATNNLAELWAMRMAMRAARDRVESVQADGCTRICVMTDSATVCHWIAHGYVKSRVILHRDVIEAMIAEICDVIQQSPIPVEVVKISRKQNKVADKAARSAADQPI
jgi:ribonuclease HI